MAADLHDPASVYHTEGWQDSAALLTNGAFALELIQRQIRRLGKLQGEVLADRDPEPLHQLRVSLRRLRTALDQFAPAVHLPAGVNEQRVADVARRTGLCRDLDVLGQRLRELLPKLPAEEQRCLKQAMKRLGEDRAKSFNTLREALHGSRYLKLLARLSRWQKQTSFTPLGLLPLLPWLSEWQAPFTAALFLDPGWLELDPSSAALHGLRKRIKRARYCLEPLEPWCQPPLQAWVDDLRQAQDHLGNLHDLQVLQRNLKDSESRWKISRLPVFHAELENQQVQQWLRWRELALRLHHPSNRQAIQDHLQRLGREGPPTG
ncbi:MAG: CHAD domain-containing protein [Cyanobacteriota bacterium]|nr:CHAD domain-containing protein [Cyanobacteriota bacterium]